MAWLKALLDTFNLSDLFEVNQRVGQKRTRRAAKKKPNNIEIYQKIGIELVYKALCIFLIISSFRIIFVDNMLFTIDFSNLANKFN